MKEKLILALDEISEKHIAEAASGKRSRRRLFLSAVAAVLAVVLVTNLFRLPMAVPARAVSKASESRLPERPNYDRYRDKEEYRQVYDVYRASQDAIKLQLNASMDSLMEFSQESTQLYLDLGEKNPVWSPVNGYIALAMVAEITDGNSRQQLLDALGVSGLEELRSRVGAIWETVYRDDGHEISTIANSLWLDKGLGYNQDTMDALSYYHYASVYQTDLDSPKAGKALRAWLNNNTGGLLKERVSQSAFPPKAVLTLASTVYLQSKWVHEFSPSRNTWDTFHSPAGDLEVEFMNKREMQTNYYWAEDFGAVHLGLKNGCKMWFFLPDADKTVEDVLSDSTYLKYLNGKNSVEDENYKYMKVNLSLPKFDITSGGDLSDMVKKMGVTDIFDIQASDFTAITSDTPVVITAVNQAARVIIDEQGVKAASYIEIPGAGAAAPPEEIIDFILDRPFVFVIATSQGVPLFTGVVNQP